MGQIPGIRGAIKGRLPLVQRTLHILFAKIQNLYRKNSFEMGNKRQKGSIGHFYGNKEHTLSFSPLSF